ncbi:MAG: DUF4149 domain-containing protein [Nitrospirae bacterium]|nr:MAG: DUF4149 domain-containing protein [Nitrospirota bacterium]
MAPERTTTRCLTFCHTLELVALAVWVGGLLVIIGAVIPAVFNSFGMEPGGRFLTRVFEGYNRLTGGAIVLLVGTSAWRVWNGAQGNLGGSLTKPELAFLSAMIVIASLITLVLGPWSVTLQEQAFAAQGDAKKTAYEAFFRIHTMVRGLYVLNLGLGIALLAVKVRDWMGRMKLDS